MAKRIDSSDIINMHADNFNFKVYAGPGAGKTFFLIENIKDIIANSKKLHNDIRRKILCITYTNVAVNEIKMRLRQFNDCVVVMTIHSFLYEYVIKPYQKQLKIIINETFGIDINDEIIMHPRIEGFGLLTKLKVSDFKGILIEKYRMDLAGHLTKNKISNCVLDISSINKTSFNFSNIPIVKNVLGQGFEEEVIKIKTALWEQEGVLDFDEILYFSYMLLIRFEFIKYDIQYLFPYVLMDEYQDTNPIQNKILNLLNDQKISIGVVGDKAQSIYGFTNATYKEFQDFHPQNKLFKEFVIAGNRRSNQNIIHFLNYLRQVDFVLEKQICISNKDDSKVKFVLCNKYGVDILDKLKIDNVKVLCRRWADAFEYITNINNQQRNYLKQVHNYYKYIIDRDLTKDFESSNIEWINNIKLIVSTYKAIQNGNFAGIIHELSKIFKLDIIQIGNKTKGNELIEIIKFVDIIKNIKLDSTYFEIVAEINKFITNTNLKNDGKLELLKDTDELYEEKFHSYLNKLEFNTLQVMYDDVFVDDSKYLSVHKTKGKEYDNILVRLVPIYEEQYWENALNMLKNPVIFGELDDKITEFVRIAYVACSRAKNNLYIHLDNTKDEIDGLINNLDKFCKNNNIQEKFYEIIDLN